MTSEEGKYEHKFISNIKYRNNCVICNEGEEKLFDYRGDTTNEKVLINVNNDIFDDNRQICMICSNELSFEEIEKN